MESSCLLLFHYHYVVVVVVVHKDEYTHWFMDKNCFIVFSLFGLLKFSFVCYHSAVVQMDEHIHVSLSKIHDFS